MNHLSVGVPIAWVGVLLSINRFVRILSNGLMVAVFAKYGMRAVMIAAVALAILSTVGYALATVVVFWIVLRICWGLSFSAMRIGTVGYALQHPRQGIALGVSRSLQEAGPMIALFIAPVLLNNLDNRHIFFLLAVLSLPALYFAWCLPRSQEILPASKVKPFIRFPSALNSITLMSATVIDGIVVVVLGVLFLHHKNDMTLLMATTFAAFYLGYRRICLVALSPVAGWMADRFGLDNLFNLSIAIVIFGLIVLALGWVAVGSVIVFAFYSVHVAITPGAATKGELNSLDAVAENATWRDIGAAIGTLLGGFLIASPYLIHALFIAIFVLLVSLAIHLGTMNKPSKLLYLWK